MAGKIVYSQNICVVDNNVSFKPWLCVRNIKPHLSDFGSSIKHLWKRVIQWLTTWWQCSSLFSSSALLSQFNQLDCTQAHWNGTTVQLFQPTFYLSAHYSFIKSQYKVCFNISYSFCFHLQGTIHPFRKTHRSICAKLQQEFRLVTSDRRVSVCGIKCIVKF